MILQENQDDAGGFASPGARTTTPGEPGFVLARLGWLLAAAFLAITTYAGISNFLLFHVAMELSAVVVSCCIFALAWNACRKLDNSFLMFLGVAHLVVAVVQFLHAVAYKGMNILPSGGANLPTQLWVAARYVEAGALLAAPSFLTRRVPHQALLAGGAGLLALLWATIFFQPVFPAAFTEPGGLTTFKKISEYVVCVAMAVALWRFYLHRAKIGSVAFGFLAASTLFMIAAELFFTFYVSVFGISNFAGHVLKTLGVLFLFEAVVASGLREPLAHLYRSLEENRAKLESERDALKTALAEVETLSGLLPICSHCKKIRDDKGYWSQVETYISKRSKVSFTHGVCPECMEEHYGEVLRRYGA